MDAQTLIFLHVPKTAGRTMELILERQYQLREVYVARRREHDVILDDVKACGLEPSEVKLFVGHMPFGLHAHLLQSCRYFTLLRDPVERVISDYYFVRRNPEHRRHSKVVEEGLTLEDYLLRSVDARKDNEQTRQIAGAEDGLGPSTSKMLEIARNNLSTHFAALGLTERFDETLVLLRHVFGWKNLYYTRMNVTPGRPRQEDHQAEILELIRRYIQFDSALYGYANQLFDERIRQIPNFEQELQEFQARNRQIGGLITLYQRIMNKGRSILGLETAG